MTFSTQVVSPGPSDRTVRNERGQVLIVPAGWELLPPGDPGWTRRVKSAGEHWVVQERKGRKLFSHGVWAPAATIRRIEEELRAERSTESYARKRASAERRREKVQQEYVGDFVESVRSFLNFHPRHEHLSRRLAITVAEHATPVGSGTVARTQRIPITQRAEAAVIAWMRHQTTAYDNMKIARIRGERREVRRMLAERSRSILDRYRRGEPCDKHCPLAKALESQPTAG